MNTEDQISTDIFSLIDEEISKAQKADEDNSKESFEEINVVPEKETDIISENEISDSHDISTIFHDEAKEETIPKAKKKREVGKRTIDTIFDFVELFIFTLVAVLIITTFVFRHSVVSGPSMMNTLQNGDKLIITNLFYEPEYMDIVVVEDYSCGMDSPIVKRVIATEGDTVRITHEGIWVNGEFLIENDYVWTEGKDYRYVLDPYPFEENSTLVNKPGEYIEFVVPEDEIFLLGDHRNNSKDSRFYGTIREDSILGKVVLRLSPFTIYN